MILVDEIRVYPGARAPFHRGSCHMMTDGALDELHVFAVGIGLRRAWFQPHPLHPHYDLTPSRREAALAAGAVFVPAKEQARRRLDRARSAASPARADVEHILGTFDKVPDEEKQLVMRKYDELDELAQRRQRKVPRG